MAAPSSSFSKRQKEEQEVHPMADLTVPEILHEILGQLADPLTDVRLRCKPPFFPHLDSSRQFCQPRRSH